MELKFTIRDSAKTDSKMIINYRSCPDNLGRLVSTIDAEYLRVLDQKSTRILTMGSLLLLKNGAPQIKFTLGDSTLLGRSSECQIQLLDTQLSRQHTKIEKRGDNYWIEDLNSKNGTFLSETRINEPCKLRSGDEIRMGSLSLIFDPIIDLIHDRNGEKSFCLVDEGPESEPEYEQLSTDPASLDREAVLAVHKMTCEVISNLDLELLLDSFLDRLIEHFHADRGFVLLIDERSGKIKPAAIRTPKSSVALSRRLMERALASKAPILVRNALEDVSFVGSRSIVEHQLRSVMLVPLLAGDKVIGLLQIDNEQKDSFDQTSLAQLSMMAGFAALSVENAKRFKREQQKNEATVSNKVGQTRFVGENAQIKNLLQTVTKTAITDARVLITGDSGTGKELIARMIHERSPRATGPWVAINCAAIPENLLESELFGHEKGAFTGASRQKRGSFEIADGGTLFLDEIGELPQRMQVKLLRAIQDSCFYRLGSEKPIQVDLRIVAATNRDLGALISDGSFREDLYYRLNVIGLKVPPLRERPEDIGPMVKFFAKRLGRSLGKNVRFTSTAIARLQEHSWPGNVRELHNVVERVMVLTDSTEISAKDLPLDLAVKTRRQKAGSGNLHEVLAATEIEMIRQALMETDGNKSAACRSLGISRPTMDKKIEQYGIDL